MIALVRGVVARRTPDGVVVDVGGVGYAVRLAALDGAPPRGEEVELHTSLQVREDDMTLYGFPTVDQLELFELLLTTSGVGPKLALAALGVHDPTTLRAALASGDLGALTAIPGVGKKVAQRLLLELKDKVGAAGDAGRPGAGAEDAGTAVAADPRSEARAALRALGYSAAETQAALQGVGRDGDAGELLRAALRRLGDAVDVA